MRDDNEVALDTFIAKRSDLLALAIAIVRNRSVAEELVQDSWLVWTKKKYPSHKAEPILKRIVLNLARDQWRRQRREWACYHAISLLPATDHDEERVFIARETVLQVAGALSQLPERTIEAFRLHRIEGLTYVEIAKRLEIAPSRAHQLVCNALVKIALIVDE